MGYKLQNKKSSLLKGTLAIALGLSLLGHLAFMVSSLPELDLSAFKKQKTPQRVRIVLQPSKPKKVELDDHKGKQIVNTEESQFKEKPKDSKFVGKHNQVVDRQTKAKEIGSFKTAGKGVRDGKKILAPQKKVNPTKAKKKRKSKLAKKLKKRSKRKVSLADLAVGNRKKVKEVKASNPSLAALGLKTGARGQVGLSRNNDYIEEVPLGDMTNLNTSELKHYGFYHRIRQQLEQYWTDNLREQADMIYKQGRRLPASTDRMTNLLVTLDREGNVKEVAVKSSSGVLEFDQAAIESFNRAGPFPNPPKGMVKNGTTQIRWSFVVKS